MSSKSPETRTRILESALTLLEAGAASGVRMSDIAKATGISRQALYLHFPNRADLLVATTRYLDDVKDVDVRLAASRSSGSGVERLSAFVTAWGNYIPEIYGVAKALMAMLDTDAAAKSAWNNRMQAMREGCEAAVAALAEDGVLLPQYSVEQGTDLLWVLLSVRNWEQMRFECGWSQAQYISMVGAVAHRMLVSTEV